MFIIPSIRHESGAVDGLPVVVPEAMAASLPVIGSDVGGIPVLIKNGCNGILVKERDVNGIANAIERLVKNPSLRREYGERSRQIVDNSVNYDNISEYFVSLYREIALNKTPAPDIPPFAI